MSLGANLMIRARVSWHRVWYRAHRPPGESANMEAVPAIATSTPSHCRRADRRAGIETLVRRVAADLLNTNHRRNFALFLTERLAQLTRVRSVRLNEISGTMAPRSLQPVRVRDYVAYSVPVREEGRQVMLEAAFDGRTGPDDWTCQMLEAAASLAGVLLEAERLATTPAPLTSADRDGAAPLIGSSEIMRLLRERVERVANTHFTVLIEGPRDPQQSRKDREFQRGTGAQPPPSPGRTAASLRSGPRPWLRLRRAAETRSLRALVTRRVTRTDPRAAGRPTRA